MCNNKQKYYKAWQFSLLFSSIETREHNINTKYFSLDN